MPLDTSKAGPAVRAAGSGLLRNTVLAENNSNHTSLEALRASHLAVVFGVPTDTALVLAELAFGEGGAR